MWVGDKILIAFEEFKYLLRLFRVCRAQGRFDNINLCVRDIRQLNPFLVKYNTSKKMLV